MKKTVVTVVILIITTFTVMSQDFRNSTWGMSKSQVKSTEKSTLVKETTDLLVYQTTLAGYKVYVGYIFSGNKLTRSKYIVAEPHANNNDYISEYNFFNGLLKNKYGAPVEDKIDWKTDLYSNDKSAWGLSIMMGDLVLYSRYRTSDTEIKIILASEDYQIINEIEYSSTNPKLKNLEKEKLLKGF